MWVRLSGIRRALLLGLAACMAGWDASPVFAQGGTPVDRTIQHYEIVGEPYIVEYSPDDALLAFGSYGFVRVFEAATGELLHTLRPDFMANPNRPIVSVAFSPDNSRLAASHSWFDPEEEGPMWIWDIASGDPVTIMPPDGDAVISNLAYSPDGATLLTRRDGAVHLRDSDTLATLRSFAFPDDPIRIARFRPNGEGLLLGTEEGALVLVDTDTGAVLQEFSGHTGRISWASFSPGGARLLTSSTQDDSTRLWDPDTGEALHALERSSSIVHLLSDDADQFVALSPGHSTLQAQILDTETGEPVVTIGELPLFMFRAAVSAAGDQLAVAGLLDDVSVWELPSGTLSHQIRGHSLGSWVLCATYSPDGSHIVTGGGLNPQEFISSWLPPEPVVMWDVSKGFPEAFLEGHTGIVRSIQYSPDGSQILTAALDRTARLWDAETGALLHTFEGHPWGLVAAQFSPDGARIVVAGGEETRIYDTASRALSATFHTGQQWRHVQSLAVSPDNTVFAVSEGGGTTQMAAAAIIRRMDTGAVLRAYSPGAHAARHIAFSPDGKKLAGVMGNTVWIWDTATGEKLHELTGHLSQTVSLAFAPNGSYLAAASGAASMWGFPDFGVSNDLQVRMWSVETGEQKLGLRFNRAASVAFSPDGTRLAATSEWARVIEWDISDINPFLVGDVNNDGAVNAVDVQLVINAALGLEIPPGYRADRNFDLQVNAVDVQLVINDALGVAK